MKARLQSTRDSVIGSLRRERELRSQRETRCKCVVAIATLFALVLSVPDTTSAAPETWFSPEHTFTGTSSSNFGAAVSCSTAVAGLGHSYFAIGAPRAASGEGRVYVYSPTGLVQTLTAPSVRPKGNFGYSVTFVKDINDDSLDELAIGEPNNDEEDGTGIVHMYLSTGVLQTPYTHCGNASSSFGFGSFISPTSIAVSGGVQIVISNPTAAEIRAYDVTDSGFSCPVVATGDFQSNGPGGPTTRFGQSLGESLIMSNGLIGGLLLVVGAPRDGFGAVYSKAAVGSPALMYGGASDGEQYGVSVASRLNSHHLAFNAPYAAGGINTVYVKTRSPVGGFNDFCSLSVPMADLSEFAGQSLVHLFTAFDAFTASSGGGVAFGTYRTEASTGGSVGLFGAAPAGQCTSVKQVNNCASDPGQKQGQALTGGPTCIGNAGRKLLIVGAPGYSSNAGRVDVYAEGTESGSAVPCGVPTNTPTATPTATATPTPTAGSAVTVEPTATAAPGSDGSPTPVDPKTGNLPAPVVSQTTKVVVIEAPRFITKDKKFPFIGWLFTILSRNSKPQSAAALTVEALSVSAKKRQLFSKRNRVALRNLKPGTYAVSYQPVFRRASGKNTRVLGRKSKSASFTVK